MEENHIIDYPNVEKNLKELTPMSLGQNLTKLRLSQNMTQEDLAEKLSISRSTVAKWESGEGWPKIPNLISLRNLFNISIDDLLEGESGMRDITPSFSITCNCCKTNMIRNNERFWTCTKCGNNAFRNEDGKLYYQYEPLNFKGEKE